REFLIERFGISHAPSLSVLRFCRRRNSRRNGAETGPPASALAVGVAAAGDESPAWLEADAERLAEIGRTLSLPTRVVQLVGSKPENDRRPASKAAILEEAPAHELIHIACHGVFGDNSVDPLDSGLLVSDGEEVLAVSRAEVMTPQDRHRWMISARD